MYDLYDSSITNDYVHTMDMELIQSALEPYWLIEHETLSNDFDTTCNDPYVSPISIISCKLTSGRSITELITMSDNVYGVMNMLSDVEISKEIELKVTSPGEQMTGTFHKLVYDNQELWYVGPYVDKHHV